MTETKKCILCGDGELLHGPKAEPEDQHRTRLQECEHCGSYGYFKQDENSLRKMPKEEKQDIIKALEVLKKRNTPIVCREENSKNWTLQAFGEHLKDN